MMVVSARSWLANEGGKHFVLMMWLGANTWLFVKTFLLYCSGQQYHYLYKMLGLGLCISRASASVLNLNCSLVLLPMCRTLLTFVRGTHTVSSRKTRRLLDRSKTFHVACGVAICIFSAFLQYQLPSTPADVLSVFGVCVFMRVFSRGIIVAPWSYSYSAWYIVHVSAHLVNVMNFSSSYSEDFPALNFARYKGEDPKRIILTTVPGITGVLLVVILFLMFTSSSYCVRIYNYEIFWYTHNLFIIFYIILMVHMVGGALKYQTNIEAHPPGCLRANHSRAEEHGEELEKREQEEMPCKAEAHFQPHFPQTWLWVSGPLCLYCAERLYRYIRSSDPVTIVTVIRHPCDVIELRMLKKNFKARPGQYIVLNCPNVSSFENHPFTLTACPTENKETFGIHLRVVGDWTERFTQMLLPDLTRDLDILPVVHQRRYPKLYVDGPFGSPSEEVFNYDVSLCVAGGIGVTPFACVLHALLDGWMGFRLKRLYFVWVCRELRSFYWFAELLSTLHHKLWHENKPDYLNLKLYVSQADNLQGLNEEKYRLLASRLLVGRPRWKLLFDEIGRTNKRKRVGVFCCGPKGISRTLHRLCNSAHFPGTTFEFNKESFS